MECEFIKTSAGLMPADDPSREWLGKVKVGRIVRGAFVQPRNPHFHRKFFALLSVAFDYFEETAPRIEYKGEQVAPDFKRFRKDITILAGRFHLVTNLKGEIRAEADSISFGSMKEDEFQQLYDKVITVLMERVLTGPQWSREKIEETVEQIAEFAS